MSAATDRSIKTILNELEFLNEEGIVDNDEYNQMVGVLAAKTREARRNQTGGAAAPTITATAAPAEPQGRILEAKYEFTGSEKTDLSLKPGMRIELIEELNNDWWRGRALETGTIGVFPSNYVVPAETEMNEKQAYEHSNASTNSSYYTAAPSYYGQQMTTTQSNNYPQPYDPSTTYTPNGSVGFVQESQTVVVQQPEQQQHRMPEGVKRFGRKFGNAAIFGAGATVGADIINGIF